MPVLFTEINERRHKSWQTTLGILLDKGIEFKRNASATGSIGLVGLMLFVIVLIPFVRGSSNIDLLVVLSATVVIGGGMLVAWLLDRSFKQSLLLTDTAIEQRFHSGKRRKILLKDLSATGMKPYFKSALRCREGAWIWLPSTFDGRDFLVEFAEWVVSIRREIGLANGSFVRGLDGAASGKGLRFEFDWWGTLVSTLCIAGLFALFGWVFIKDNASVFEVWMVFPIVVIAVVTAIFGWLIWAALSNWKLLGVSTIVSSGGIRTVRGGKTLMSLTWDEITTPEAIRQRKENFHLACDTTGTRFISSDAMRSSKILEAVVDHFLIRELERRRRLSDFKPTDLRPELDEDE